MNVEAPPPPKGLTVPVIVTGGVAAAALVTGVVFAIVATGKHSDYNNGDLSGVPASERQSKIDALNQTALDGEHAAFYADLAFGTAALFGITAAALYFIHDEAPAQPKTTATAQPKIQWMAAPSVTPQGGGVSALVKF
jgi:hypothetical protein